MVNMIMMMRKRTRLLMKMKMMRRRLMRRMMRMCETLAGVRATLLWVEFCLLSPAEN